MDHPIEKILSFHGFQRKMKQNEKTYEWGSSFMNMLSNSTFVLIIKKMAQKEKIFWFSMRLEKNKSFTVNATNSF